MIEDSEPMAVTGVDLPGWLSKKKLHFLQNVHRPPFSYFISSAGFNWSHFCFQSQKNPHPPVQEGNFQQKGRGEQSEAIMGSICLFSWCRKA